MKLQLILTALAPCLMVKLAEITIMSFTRELIDDSSSFNNINFKLEVS